MVPPLCLGCLPLDLGCLPLDLSSVHYHEVRTVPKVVEEVFKEFAQGKEFMSALDVTSFVEKFQGDAISDAEAQSLIADCKETPWHHHLFFYGKDEGRKSDANSLDLAEFVRLLLSPNLNPALKSKQMIHDMTAPLSHYYIHTSHNSYLTGNQLWSSSSTAPICKALDEGCRVIELDCWEKNGKIKVLHGGTLTKAVNFEDCVTAIKEHAFQASPYPVIITIENHLRPERQIEAGKILKDILGDILFIPNAEQRCPVEFLSPEELKGKILISDKPFHELLEQQVKEDPIGAVEIFGRGDESPDLSPRAQNINPDGFRVKTVETGARAIDGFSPDEEIPYAEEFDALLYIHCQKPTEMEHQHVKGGPLVSGPNAIMANISEPQLKGFIKTHPGSIIEYTKTNFGRVYPHGLRFDSSNADPMSAWSHGCQLAALNLQGQDRAAWLANGFFYSNGGCGYVKKPQVFLPESTLKYEDILHLPPKLRLKVKILLGTDWHTWFDFFKNPDFYVLVAVKGIPPDTLRKRTKVAFRNNEPSWEDEEFEFPIRVPEIAMLRIEVWEDDILYPDDFVGQFSVRVNELRQGIRVIPLQSKQGKEQSSKLLCQFKLEDLNLSEEIKDLTPNNYHFRD